RRLKAPTVSLPVSSMFAAGASVVVAVFYPPPGGEQRPYPGLSVAVVDEMHNAPILVAAYHPSGGLYHFLDAGVQIGIVVAAPRAGGAVHALFYLLVHGVDLRQPQRRDEGADQPASGKVDAFGERAAQNGEADAPAIRGEALQEMLPAALVHSARLPPYRNVRAKPDECVGRLLHVIEAAEVAQVIAGPLPVLGLHEAGDGGQGSRPLRVARGYAGGDADLKLVRPERGFHVHPCGVFGQPQRVPVEGPGTQGGREQRRGAAGGIALFQERRRDQVAYAEQGILPPKAFSGAIYCLDLGTARQRDVEDGVAAKRFRHPEKMQDVEMQSLQC